jgi:hypothetical protein
MYTEYYDFKEPTLNCKDMDARLRGVLMSHIGKPTNYQFSGRAHQALVKRAKEVTPSTIELLLRGMPDTFKIIDLIWHVFPEAIMDRIITSDYWESENCGGYIPQFMKDYILKQGETLLLKYESSNMILTNLLARNPQEYYQTSGMEDHRSVETPMTSPTVYLKYYKRYRSLDKRWRHSSGYEEHVIGNIGRYVMERKLDIEPHYAKTMGGE